MNKTIIRAVIAGGIILSFLSIVVLLYFVVIPDANKDYATTLLGALIVLTKEVVQWYFGSSQGSEDKTAIINKNT